MSNTKQPPSELVEKIRKVRHHVGFGGGWFDLSDVVGGKVINEIAQIAVQHAEEENRELREFIQEVMETTTDKIRYDKAKQLLNK